MQRLMIHCLALGWAAAGTLTAAALAQDAKEGFGSWGVDLSAMDPSVHPGDNFYDYVDGTWIKNAQLPPDRPVIGGIYDLRIVSEQRMQALVDSLNTRAYSSLDDNEKKIHDLYDAYIDQGQIERRGLKPVQADLDDLAKLKTLNDIARAMGSARLGTESVYDVAIGVDDKDPTAYSVNLVQGGLGLPNRDFYLRDDAPTEAVRTAYRKYLTDLLTLADTPDAKSRAQKVYEVELALAKVEWGIDQVRQADQVYNPMPYSALKRLTPQFPWNVFLKEIEVPVTRAGHERTFIVEEKSAFPAIAKIFASTPVAVWRDYLRVHYLAHYAAFLPKRFDDANFAFNGKVLSGQAEQLPRSTRGAHMIDALMGEALGKLYVDKYFPPASKEKIDALVANLLKAYENDIKTLDWMSPETREAATQKLHLLSPKIGYPSRWRDYSALVVKREDLIGDYQRASVFEWHRRLKRLDQTVDRDEWVMTTPTVNAYYRQSYNDITFPAAILQPPFFDPAADPAVNYGAIGAVIGHEMSHGFDDQGSKYDGHGVLRDWWTAADRANFDARTTALVQQFDAFEPLPGLHIIGKNTLGENIADLAGLSIALKAYHLSLNGAAPPVIDGYSADQRFFMAFAQIWRAKMTNGLLRTRVLSDFHSPPAFRVIGTTRNIDAWYDAFAVQPDAKYYLSPDQRVRLW